MTYRSWFVFVCGLFTLAGAGDVWAQTCSPPPTCTANQASKWNGSGWECVDVSPHIVGGVELVYKENTGEFGYCRLAWGAAKCAGAAISCTTGTLVHTGAAHDKIAPSEDVSPGKFISAAGEGAHIGKFNCIYQK